MKKINLISILFACTLTVLGQNSDESNTYLELTGKIVVKGKSNLEIANCIANSAMIVGVTSYSELESECIESCYVKGRYAYSYYVNDYGSKAGSISFKYEYKIINNIISYSFNEFIHDGTGTQFKSIGNIPEKWNQEVGEIFTEKQYTEIMNDLFINYTNAIRMIKKYCVN
jgi:hypothetical protein